MMRILLLFAVLMLEATCASGQTVNGLQFNESCTQAQIRKKLGRPIRCEVQQSELGIIHLYRFGTPQKGCQITYDETYGGLTDIAINSHKYWIGLRDGRLRIGDHISKVEIIGLPKPVLRDDGAYFVNVADDAMLLVVDDKMRIRGITFTASN